MPGIHELEGKTASVTGGSAGGTRELGLSVPISIEDGDHESFSASRNAREIRGLSIGTLRDEQNDLRSSHYR